MSRPADCAAHPWQSLQRAQRGVVSRKQALQHGCSDGFIEAQLRARRWQRVHPGVYAVFTGALDFDQRVWAALLACGEGAMASHRTAALLDGLVDGERHEAHRHVEVIVPKWCRVVAPAGVRVHYREHADERRHPARLPARTRIEETVLDVWEQCDRLDNAFAVVVAAACQRQLTTPDRLLSAAQRRKKVRRRQVLESSLSEVDRGAHSVLELLYLRDVERAHGLPRGQRQRVIVRLRRYYSDVTYLRYASRIELDGRVWHPDRARDRHRDNVTVLSGQAGLSYGWPEITGTPCQTASEVAQLLQRRGWRGMPKPCGPRCPLARAGRGSRGS